MLEPRYNIGACGGGQPCHLLFPKTSGFPGERVSTPKETAGQLGVGPPSPPRFGNQVRQGWKQPRTWSDSSSYPEAFLSMTWRALGSPHAQVQPPEILT